MESTCRWIDERYISNCLKTPQENIVDYRVESAVGKGNNYASILLRVKVETKGKTKNNFESFLIKCLPDGVMKTLIQDAGLWDKEVQMYKKVLPLIEKYVGQKIGPKCLNSSNMFYDSTNEKEIVLEDLSKNYKMADRVEQLDYDHCVVVMKTIAKFHAGSVAVRRYYKEEIDFVGEEICFRDTRRESNENYMKRPFQCLANELKGNIDLKRYSYCLDTFAERFWDLAVTATKPKQFNVLNHGDLWTNNILFEYDELTGDVKGARLVDFQCCRYTSPAFDLQHFFMSSVKEAIRETKLQQLVDIYINCLNKELINLGESAMLEKQLDKDLVAMDCYGLYSALAILPMSIRDPEDVSDKEDISDVNTDKNPFVNCIRGKRFQKLLPNILMYFEKKGLFEDGYDVSDKFEIEEESNERVLI